MEIEFNLDKIKLLSELTLFEDFNADEKAEFAGMIHRKTFKPGDVICREGDSGGEMYLLQSGVVEVQKTRPHGAGQIVIARYDRGGVLGEMALIDGRDRSATIVSTEITEIYIITKQTLDDIIETKPQLAVKFLKGLARILSLKLRETSGLFADVF